MLDAVFIGAIQAIGYLFAAGIIVFIYNFSREQARGKPYWEVLWYGIITSLILAGMLANSVGKPDCIEKEEGIYSSVCVEYADNGYEPTNTEVALVFTRYFILILVPVIIGSSKGKKENQAKES